MGPIVTSEYLLGTYFVSKLLANSEFANILANVERPIALGAEGLYTPVLVATRRWFILGLTDQLEYGTEYSSIGIGPCSPKT